MPTFAGLPELSCVCTVSAAEHAPALSVCAALLKASLQGVTVSVCVAVAVNAPLPVTMIVGDPATEAFM